MPACGNWLARSTRHSPARSDCFQANVPGKQTAGGFVYATANRQTVLKLSDDPKGLDTRTVTVVPVESDTALRRRAWVEANRTGVS